MVVMGDQVVVVMVHIARGLGGDGGLGGMEDPSGGYGGDGDGPAKWW